MAAVYTNSLNLFNLTTKSTPTTADLISVGDVAVTGVPLKQITIGSMPAGNTQLTSNTQNTNYNLVSGDKGKVILSTQAISGAGFTYTLLAPGTAGAGWYCYFVNQNLSAFASNFLSPASGTINGKISYQLLPGNSCYIFTDGSNYYVITNQSQWGKLLDINFFPTLPGSLSTALSTTLTQTQGVLLNSNVVVFPFYVPHNLQVVSASVDVAIGLAASTTTVGIYYDNGGNSRPSGAALGAVSIATASTGVQGTNFGTPIQLYANNIYWVAIQTSSAVTLSLGNTQVNSDQYTSGAYQAGTYIQLLANSYSAGTLPTWSGTGSSFQNYLPWISFLPG